jgi:glycosyltransferase involved in cell wall biosynthesis
MSPQRTPRLLMLAVGMGTGGAEALIRDSLPLLRQEGFDVTLRVLKQARGGASAGEAVYVPPARLTGELRQGGFDLIHSHLFWANLMARGAGRWAGVPVIVNSHHGTDCWLSLSRRLLERSTSPLADRIVACSEAVRGFALDRVGLSPEKVVTIPNGIPMERFAQRGLRESVRASLGVDPNATVIGSVGRLDEPVKGYSILVEAMAIVSARAPGTICLIAGDGPARRGLEAAVVRQDLSRSVRFLGERQDIPRLLQGLDLYVQPSRLEGFGLSVLEAMASRLAVVATRAGGLPEVVEEGVTGNLVAPGDAVALAEGLLAMLADAGRRSAYAAAGEARARGRFPLSRMVTEWSGLYRSLLAEKVRREAA